MSLGHETPTQEFTLQDWRSSVAPSIQPEDQAVLFDEQAEFQAKLKAAKSSRKGSDDFADFAEVHYGVTAETLVSGDGDEKLVEAATTYADMELEVAERIEDPIFCAGLDFDDRREIREQVLEDRHKTVKKRYGEHLMQLDAAAALETRIVERFGPVVGKGINELPAGQRVSELYRLQAREEEKAAAAERLRLQREADEQARIQATVREVAQALPVANPPKAKPDSVPQPEPEAPAGGQASSRIKVNKVNNDRLDVTFTLPTPAAVGRKIIQTKNELKVDIANLGDGAKNDLATGAAIAGLAVSLTVANTAQPGHDQKEPTSKGAPGESISLVRHSHLHISHLLKDKHVVRMPSQNTTPAKQPTRHSATQANPSIHYSRQATNPTSYRINSLIEQGSKSRLKSMMDTILENSPAVSVPDKRVVSHVDSLAYYAVARLAGPGVSQEKHDHLSDDMIIAMSAVRNPKHAETTPIVPKTPQTDFQKELATMLRAGLFAQTAEYTDSQKELLSNLLTEIIDDFTPQVEQAQVLKDFDGLLKLLAQDRAVSHGNGGTRSLAHVTSTHQQHKTNLHQQKPRKVKLTLLDRFQKVMAWQESRGNPWQPGSAGAARGKFQYIDSTWNWSVGQNYKAARKYSQANTAPESVQDMVFHMEYQKKFQQYHGNVFKIAVSHFYPVANQNPALLDKVPPANTITPRQYANSILHMMHSHGPWDQVLLHYRKAPGFHHRKPHEQSTHSTSNNKHSYSHAHIAERAQALQDLSHRMIDIALGQYEMYKGQSMEPGGQNIGDAVQKYTNDRIEPWCADFLSWVAEQAGHPIGDISGVATMAAKFKKDELFFDSSSKAYSPQAGDFMFLNHSEHVAMVTKVAGNIIETVAGNTSADGTSSNGDRISVRKLNYQELASLIPVEFGRFK